jgi:hypothetical protein
MPGAVAPKQSPDPLVEHAAALPPQQQPAIAQCRHSHGVPF